ncbi:C-terminal binding protein [uncultured Aliiroseovarius sp.]|uniref:C-terminal binding protein n=1 Tax=uncultured Aliiroseovarius sp. TaxID=1658783 RepID=UPI002594A3F4|nr:C-terminal binding protein [uncultured Aliiroseovarius sp.]
MKRFVVTDQAFGNTDAEEKAAGAAGAEFNAHQVSTEDDTAKVVAGAHVVLNNFAPMTHRVMSGLAKDAVVVRYGVGVDNVDLEAARALGVRVCNVPDYGVEEVADHAAAMATFLARKVAMFDAGIRRGEWKIGQMVPGLRSLGDTTVGLVGFGRIAQALARRMQAFGCTVIAHDPYVNATVAADMGVELAALDDVIARAHIVSLHVPLLAETRHLLNAARLAALPEGAIVINASRGGLIDEDALAKALTNGKVAAAGLDVFEAEPLPETSALRSAPNLFMSPHAAFYSDGSVKRLQQLAADEGLRALRGEPLRCQVA